MMGYIHNIPQEDFVYFSLESEIFSEISEISF